MSELTLALLVCPKSNVSKIKFYIVPVSCISVVSSLVNKFFFIKRLVSLTLAKLQELALFLPPPLKKDYFRLFSLDIIEIALSHL